MNWKIVGVFLLIFSLFLIALMSVRVASYKRNVILESKGLVMVPSGPWAYNITLEPLGKVDYTVEVEVYQATIRPIMLDLWVVNETEYGILRRYFDLIFPLTGIDGLYAHGYPDEGEIFGAVVGHAKEVNITGIRRFQLRNLNRNGIYCFFFINLYDEPQYIGITVEELYREAERSIIELNPVTFSLTAICGISGLLITLNDGIRKKKRRVKRRVDHLTSAILELVLLF